MTKKEAEKLRKEWRERGSLACDHPKLVLESTSDGYLTGVQVCIVCGAISPQKPS